jgi:hypothetical protein
VGNLVRSAGTKDIGDANNFGLIDVRMDLDARRCACQVVGPQPSETRQEFSQYMCSVEKVTSIITDRL